MVERVKVLGNMTLQGRTSLPPRWHVWAGAGGTGPLSGEAGDSAGMETELLLASWQSWAGCRLSRTQFFPGLTGMLQLCVPWRAEVDTLSCVPSVCPMQCHFSICGRDTGLEGSQWS